MPDWRPTDAESDRVVSLKRQMRHSWQIALEDYILEWHAVAAADVDAFAHGWPSAMCLRQRAVAPHAADDLQGFSEMDLAFWDKSPRAHRYDYDEPLLPFDKVEEFVCKSYKWDNGHCWGRDGHWPLYVTVGSVKHYSKEHWQRYAEKDAKRLQ